jgi:anhydro-N-acetylmuramic acid kinase
MTLYIGLMSGTSLDGVDGVLVELDDAGTAPPGLRAHVHREMPEGLRAELLALNASGSDELHRAALAANALMHLYAEAVDALLGLGQCAAGEAFGQGGMRGDKTFRKVLQIPSKEFGPLTWRRRPA